MTSRYSSVTTGPPIEVFALNKAYLDDTNANKVNLGVGGKCISLISSKFLDFGDMMAITVIHSYIYSL
jgi:hypothetical protein